MDLSQDPQDRARTNLGDSETDPFEFPDMSDDPLADHDDLQWEESLYPIQVSPSASRRGSLLDLSGGSLGNALRRGQSLDSLGRRAGPAGQHVARPQTGDQNVPPQPENERGRARDGRQNVMEAASAYTRTRSHFVEILMHCLRANQLPTKSGITEG
eukprot:2999135-Pyramimonas_sp.AAC.1